MPLVQDGTFVGYLSSRETAPRIGRSSGGAMRADGWNRIPLIRMTNINLLPRPGMSLDDIVADTDDGLYLASNRSWSIDDRRLNFQFATEVAYEIKGGKKGRLFKNPTYTGHHLRVLAIVRRRRRRAELRDARHAELRQGRAEPDRTCRPCRPGSALPRCPGRGRQVVSRRVNDDRARDALDLARRALDAAMREGATEAEALVLAEDASLTRFANSQIHQNVAETNVTVNLRVVIGKRVGVASSGRTDAEGLRRLAENATAIARVVEELEDWAGLPAPDDRRRRRRRATRRRPRRPRRSSAPRLSAR